MARSIKDIESDIKDAELEINNPSNSADEIKDFKEILAGLNEELKEAKEKGDKKPAPAPKKAPEKKKPAAPAHKKEEKKEEKKPETSEEKFEKEQQKREYEEAKAEQKGKTFIVAGKEYSMDDCKDLILSLKARKNQAKKNNKQYKTKKPATKAAENAEDMVGQIADAIPDKKVEANPKQVISVLKEFKSKMESAFNVLGKIISATDLAILKKSLKEIDEIVAKYSK